MCLNNSIRGKIVWLRINDMNNFIFVALWKSVQQLQRLIIKGSILEHVAVIRASKTWASNAGLNNIFEFQSHSKNRLHYTHAKMLLVRAMQ